MPTSAGSRTFGQRLLSRWTIRMIRLAAAGDEPCSCAFARVYHLVGAPTALFGPAVARAVLRSLVRGVPDLSRRPDILDEVVPTGATQP